MIRTLMMAGGRSQRMRATAGPLHKALVPVSGIPLIERNLQALLLQGFRDVVVAVNERELAIGDYLQTRGRGLATEAGARLEILWEQEPLGTIGAARLAIHDAEALVVVNVDNLTSIDLQKFAAYHIEVGAAFTIATHEENFQIPFGELQLSGNHVEAYMEKAVKPIWISSGTYVAGPEATEFIFAGERTDVPQLVSRLLASGKYVAAFRHQADWIDVNDADAVRRAEEQFWQAQT
jgi:NDP-sugar pyrophosphorylase family protein